MGVEKNILEQKKALFLIITTVIMIVSVLLSFFFNESNSSIIYENLTISLIYSFVGIVEVIVPLINMICCFVVLSKENKLYLSLIKKKYALFNAVSIIASLSIGFTLDYLIGYSIINIFNLSHNAFDVFLFCWSTFLFVIISAVYKLIINIRKRNSLKKETSIESGLKKNETSEMIQNEIEETKSSADTMDKLNKPNALNSKKSNSNIINIVIIAMTIAIVTLGSLNIIQFNESKNNSKVLAEKESEIQKKDNEIMYYKEKYENEKSLKNKWFNKYYDVKEDADFLENYIVFVYDDGTGYYHKYSCPFHRSDRYWAYNIEAAQGEYTPCPYCK